MYIKCWYSSKKGDYRENNEDNLFVCGEWLSEGHVNDSGSKKIALGGRVSFGVFDGLGGELKGEAASFIAARELNNNIDIADYFTNTNEKVLQIECGGNKRVGSTAAVLRFEGSRYCAANLGDSRIYLIRNGRARRLTTDHTLAETMIKAGVMTEEAVRKNSFRNYLTQCFGGEPDEDNSEIDPYISKFDDVMADDIFVLCSDGFWGAVSRKEMEKAVSERTGNVAETMTNMAYTNGARDNVTVVVLYICKDSVFGAIRKSFFKRNEVSE